MQYKYVTMPQVPTYVGGYLCTLYVSVKVLLEFAFAVHLYVQCLLCINMAHIIHCTHSLYSVSVLEITVGLRTLSDHFGHWSDPKMLGSDIWPSTIKELLP